MDPTLHKVRQLIGMTGSSNVEEARSMALAACQMVLKHGLIISMPPKEGEAAQSVSPDDLDFPFHTTVGGGPTPRARTPAAPTSSSRPTPPPRATKAKASKKKGSHWESADKADKPVRLASKYPGRCKGCGKGYATGDTIYWRRGHGTCCDKCGPEPLGD